MYYVFVVSPPLGLSIVVSSAPSKRFPYAFGEERESEEARGLICACGIYIIKSLGRLSGLCFLK